MLVHFVFVMLAVFVAESEGISAQRGVYGKKRNKVTGLQNRFLCPGCDKKKELTTKSEPTEERNAAKLVKEHVEIHCMKGDKGDKGDRGDTGIPGTPGPQGAVGTCNPEQIEDIVRPLRTKIDALLSSYTSEIARLRSEIRYLKSEFIHTLGSEENPAKSCKEIYEKERFTPSGPYYLNITAHPGGITRVYCFMEDDETCPAGSTLVLKIDGNKDTFKYSSTLWSNKKVYAEENGRVLFDSNETKLATYWGMPFTKVCISMRKLDSLQVESLVIDESSTSLYDLIADGKYRATKGGREVWESLLPGSQLQNGCYREGFNAHGKQAESAGARIGMIAGDQSNCTTSDSFIGFGTEGGACASGRSISCGNKAGACNAVTDAEKYIPAFGYIFVY